MPACRGKSSSVIWKMQEHRKWEKGREREYGKSYATHNNCFFLSASSEFNKIAIFCRSHEKILFTNRKQAAIKKSKQSTPSIHQPMHSISRRIQLQINCIMLQSGDLCVERARNWPCWLSIPVKQQISINFSHRQDEDWRKRNSTQTQASLDIFFSFLRRSADIVVSAQKCLTNSRRQAIFTVSGRKLIIT